MCALTEASYAIWNMCVPLKNRNIIIFKLLAKQWHSNSNRKHSKRSRAGLRDFSKIQPVFTSSRAKHASTPPLS